MVNYYAPIILAMKKEREKEAAKKEAVKSVTKTFRQLVSEGAATECAAERTTEPKMPNLKEAWCGDKQEPAKNVYYVDLAEEAMLIAQHQIEHAERIRDKKMSSVPMWMALDRMY